MINWLYLKWSVFLINNFAHKVAIFLFRCRKINTYLFLFLLFISDVTVFSVVNYSVRCSWLTSRSTSSRPADWVTAHIIALTNVTFMTFSNALYGKYIFYTKYFLIIIWGDCIKYKQYFEGNKYSWIWGKAN